VDWQGLAQGVSANGWVAIAQADWHSGSFCSAVRPGGVHRQAHPYDTPPFDQWLHAAEAGADRLAREDFRHACAAWIDAERALPVDIRRRLHRALNERLSGHATAGLTVLLALCGWISGGEEGAKQAVVGGVSFAPASLAPSLAMSQRRDARRLHAFEAPELFRAVHLLSRRAGLVRVPEIFVLPDQGTMNAFALGGPDDAVITVTRGLLGGMSEDEIVAILAHEIAHIRNSDGWTMELAANLQRAIRLVSFSGLAPIGAVGPHAPLSWFLRSAPAFGELLCLALSRTREYAADALAIELISDGRTLTSALEKLERHHRPARAPAGTAEDRVLHYLHSHPSTERRVSVVRSLA
jgi:heat shock protein HtpX